MIAMTGVVLLAAGLLGAVVFVTAYTRLAPWWHSEAGWHLVTFTAELGLVMANGLAFRIFGDYKGRAIVNLILFALIVAGIWWRVTMLIRANRGRPR